MEAIEISERNECKRKKQNKTKRAGKMAEEGKPFVT